MAYTTASLIQAVNIVLLVNNSGQDTSKFTVWQDENVVLSGLDVVRVSVEDRAKLFEHPIETEAVVTDHEIFDPAQINIQAYISISDTTTLTELEQLYLGGTVLQIRAGNKIIDKAVISARPFEISSSAFDKTLYNISFKEIQTVTSTYVAMSSAASASDVSTVNSGVISGTSSSWLYSALNGDS